MIKKFSFWVVLVLIAAVSSMVFIHWNTLLSLRLKSAEMHTLHQRQQTLGSLNLNLERYRRMSSGFRKATPEEIVVAKDHLKQAFSSGVSQLNQLDPTSDDREISRQLQEQLNNMMGVITQVEPSLFSKDAYQKPEVQAAHEDLLRTLADLQKVTETRVQALRRDFGRSESESLALLVGVGCVIFSLLVGLIIRNHLVLMRPLKRLHGYAQELGSGKSVPAHPPHMTGIHSEIQNVLNQLSQTVETHRRDRHKFLLDIVADMKAPLGMLQAGKFLLGSRSEEVDEEKQLQAAESVRRGLAIFSGSLDDLNDIVDINRLGSHLEEATVDLSELISDISRTLMGSDVGKRMNISVPPIPVWVQVDSGRLERVFIHVISKVMETIPDGAIAVSISQTVQGSFRGVEIIIQDSERLRQGRPSVGGPEQDILKHWISEHGLSMALVHKIIKAHGGNITAAGVAGTSVTVTIRLPQERVITNGLISPPLQDASVGLRGLIQAGAAAPASGSAEKTTRART